MNKRKNQKNKCLHLILRSKSKNQKIKKSLNSAFTMVEITMAIAIIGIGMAGVMALLPIGFNATRDAMADNYSADMADQFLHIIAQKAKKDWNTWISNSGATGTIHSTTATPPEQPASLYNATGYLFGEKGSTGYDEFGLYTTSAQGVYYAEARSGSIKDFSAHIKIWKSIPRIAVLDVQNFAVPGRWSHTNYDYDKVAALNIEISWPAEKPYTQREKRYYYMELFKP